jgi:hypothetical protein
MMAIAIAVCLRLACCFLVLGRTPCDGVGNFRIRESTSIRAPIITKYLF